MPQRLKIESYDKKHGVCLIRNEGTGARFIARCEPTGRVVNEKRGQQKNENEDHGKGENHLTQRDFE